jgi:site-specific DNA-methyltransferase (adenine-specific)
MKAARDAHARSDSGSAARFFYCAKTTKTDRNEGCDELPQRPGGMVSNTSGQHITRRDDGYAPPEHGNNHPTVKPTELMAYLLRLVTPPGGKALDPFMGSGSTGKAAVLEGFDFIGIEQDAAYMAIATARIAHAKAKSQRQQQEQHLQEQQLSLFSA